MKIKTKSNKMKFALKSGSPYSFKNKAGAAIAAGGFGCVFKPAIPCSGETTRSDGISKILLKKDAKDEYKETLRIRPVINKIPNNQKYFLIQEMRICQPEKLTKDDKQKFEKCHNLIRRGITESNINNNIHRLEIINLPYGGVDLSILIRKNMNAETFAKINHKLTSLITNAIVPMNKLNLIHADLKDANMLFNEKDDEIRIIDWGFGEILKKSIPRSMDGRPLQFNAPFSSILFDKGFIVFFTRVLDGSNSKITTEKMHVIAEHYLTEYALRNGHGPYILENIFPQYFDPNFKISAMKIHTMGIELIANYLTKILMEYTDFSTNKFDTKKYFFDVYIKNLDIWGALTSYLEILKALEKKTIVLESKKREKIIKLVRNILKSYLYTIEYATKPININKLVEEMKEINKVLGIKIESVAKVASPKAKVASPKAKAASPKAKAASPKAKVASPKAKNARCPNGTRRNKDTGNCDKVKKTSSKKKKTSSKKKKKKSSTSTKRTRCPNGTRRNKKTGNCEKK